MFSTTNFSELNKTKRNLSLVFTGAVFILLVLLNSLFFYGKYKQNLKGEIQILDKGGKAFFELGKRQMKGHGPNLRKFGLVNFLIKNQKTGEVVSEKDSLGIGEEISGKITQPGVSELQIDGINYLVFVRELKNEGLTSYSFKESFYSKKRLIGEFLENIFYLFLLSIFIYFLVFKLVSFSLRSVERTLKEMEEFVHNAGHELKTPLTVISSNLQLAIKTGNFKQLNQESLVELNKANSLIDGLLSLASIGTQVKFENLNLKNEIERICRENSFKAESKKIILDLNLEDFILKVSKEHFYILFSNILFNALRYSKVGGEIGIFLRSGVLEITDKGIGISKENLTKIFNRFFQEGESRESSDGFGIGLSLVKKVTEIYNWKISVDSLKGVGTSFKIKF